MAEQGKSANSPALACDQNANFADNSPLSSGFPVGPRFDASHGAEPPPSRSPPLLLFVARWNQNLPSAPFVPPSSACQGSFIAPQPRHFIAAVVRNSRLAFWGPPPAPRIAIEQSFGPRLPAVPRRGTMSLAVGETYGY